MPSPVSKHGLLIAAPSSGAGKTTITLGLLRALKRRGVSVGGAKSGPDYIDPRFHEAACGESCVNLDAWAMPFARLSTLMQQSLPDTVIIEGAMGLFDGAPSRDPASDGKGASADLARHFNIPVLLVVDASRMSHSIAALVAGFAAHDPQVSIQGIVLNKVGSKRHEEMLRRALSPLNIPVLGAVPRSANITHPDRHLGLVQASERSDLEHYLEQAADIVDAHVNVDAVLTLTQPLTHANHTTAGLAPPAQRIAIAQDEAFAFVYPHILSDWHRAGAEISFFSPLQNETPQDADFIYLPGGYPELHAGQLAANTQMLGGLRHAAAKGTQIYGECGGYMMLGDGLIDKDGTRHAMAGLLRLETSFQKRKLHLGYRDVTPRRETAPAWLCAPWKAHEFHYATTLKAIGQPLFDAKDAESNDLGPQGLRNASVCGSFMHLIDKANT